MAGHRAISRALLKSSGLSIPTLPESVVNLLILTFFIVFVSHCQTWVFTAIKLFRLMILGQILRSCKEVQTSMIPDRFWLSNRQCIVCGGKKKTDGGTDNRKTASCSSISFLSSTLYISSAQKCKDSISRGRNNNFQLHSSTIHVLLIEIFFSYKKKTGM